MILSNFFDNMNSFFKEEDDFVVDVPATAHKDEMGVIDEVRIYLPEYEQFLYFSRDGKVHAIDIKEEKEKTEERKRLEKKRIREERFPSKEVKTRKKRSTNAIS